MHTMLRQAVTRAGLILMTMALTWRVGLFIANCRRAILYPFELDYGEGIVWQQAVMILQGRGYGDITQYPFIVFHYPPVYHLLAVATAKLFGLDQLIAGRLLSAVAAVAGVICAGLIARRLSLFGSTNSRQGWFCAAATAAIGISFAPIYVWAPLMRVDMVGFAFALAGLFFALRSLDRPSQIYVAAVMFVLAVYSRQTLLSAPVACFLPMLMYDRKTALKGIATCIVLGMTALIYLTVSTHGLFLDHILAYNVNRYTLARLMLLSTVLGSLSVYITVALVSITGLVGFITRRTRVEGGRLTIAAADKTQIVSYMIVIAYFLLTSLTLLFIGKSGSSLNYVVEWSAACAILIGVALPRWHSIPVTGDNVFDRFRRFDFLVPLAVIFHIFTNPASSYAHQIARPPSLAVRYQMLDAVRRMNKPVLSDDMVLLMQAGKQVPYESAIFAELSSQGRWDSRLITRMIAEHRFAIVFTHTTFYKDRFPAPIATAIDKAYPHKIKFGQFVIHAPANN